MKKTRFIWVILVIATIGIILTLSTIGSSTSPIITILTIIGTLINLIFIYKLYKMKNDVPRWTNIAFGYAIAELLIGSPIIYTSAGGTNPTAAIASVTITAILYIVVWVLFNKHLKKVFIKTV